MGAHRNSYFIADGPHNRENPASEWALVGQIYILVVGGQKGGWRWWKEALVWNLIPQVIDLINMKL